MATEQEPQTPVNPEPAPKAAAFDDVLVAAQEQLRQVLERVTSDARIGVEQAASAIAARESELDELVTRADTERAALGAERAALAKQLATLAEKERQADLKIAEAEEINERASRALVEAMEQSAKIVEEAEAQGAEERAETKAAIERDLAEARANAEEIRADAARRVEAVRAEAERTLQRAVERSVGIVSTAEASAGRSRENLRRLLDTIEEYLREERTLDLDAELTSGEAALGADAAAADTDEPTSEPVPAAASAAAARLADVPTASEVAAEPSSPLPPPPTIDVAESNVAESEPTADHAEGSTEAVAADEAVEAYFEPAEPAKGADEQRVADAVRRAVRGWSSARPAT